MRLYFIFFTLISLNSCVYQKGKTNNPTIMSNSNVVIKFDTINLGYNQIKYKSDLKNKMLNCHPSDSFNLEVLSKFQVENILNILDEELNTNSFNNYVKTIVGKRILYLDDKKQDEFSDINIQWINIMEWHFDSKKDAKKLSKLLKTLEEGKIKRDYKPYQFDWVEEEEKIYIMFYLAQIKRGEWLDDIISCLSK